jgi:hypothetical protein
MYTIVYTGNKYLLQNHIKFVLFFCQNMYIRYYFDHTNFELLVMKGALRVGFVLGCCIAFYRHCTYCPSHLTQPGHVFFETNKKLDINFFKNTNGGNCHSD